MIQIKHGIGLNGFVFLGGNSARTIWCLAKVMSGSKNAGLREDLMQAPKQLDGDVAVHGRRSLVRRVSGMIITALLVSAVSGSFMPVNGADSDIMLKKDLNAFREVRSESPPNSPSHDARKVLAQPKARLLWADWSDQYSLGLLSKLSATLAGFVFIAIMAVLQAGAKPEYRDGSPATDNQAFGATLSALMAAFLVLIIAADLYSRCSGDAIELRQQVVESLANFVLATGLVLMMFGINWALEVYRPHASVKWTARWMFWGMLVYCWTFLIPHYGWTVEAVSSYSLLDPASATTSQYDWHQDPFLAVGMILLIALPPVTVALAERSKLLVMKTAPLYEKRYWTISIVLAGVLASIWCQTVADGVRYTGDPYRPIILEDLTRFLLWNRPRLFCGMLVGLFGLFSASCVIHLPHDEASDTSSVPD